MSLGLYFVDRRFLFVVVDYVVSAAAHKCNVHVINSACKVKLIDRNQIPHIFYKNSLLLVRSSHVCPPGRPPARPPARSTSTSISMASGKPLYA